jgi:iron-sulfur cluster insertion protein
MTIEITPTAQLAIENLCKINNKMVRLAIEAGGCHGFNKVWNLTDNVEQDDVEHLCGEGRLVIDQSSLDLIGNAKIDYLTGLHGQHFVLDVPSATNQCGCGSSFSI